MQELFHRRLKRLRKARCITQQQLAELMDITYDHYVKVENGMRNLSLPAYMRLCAALQIPSDYFLNETNRAPALSEQQRAYLQTVDPEELQALLQMLRVLYEKQEAQRA